VHENKVVNIMIIMGKFLKRDEDKNWKGQILLTTKLTLHAAKTGQTCSNISSSVPNAQICTHLLLLW